MDQLKRDRLVDEHVAVTRNWIDAHGIAQVEQIELGCKLGRELDHRRTIAIDEAQLAKRCRRVRRARLTASPEYAPQTDLEHAQRREPCDTRAFASKLAR